MKIPAGKIVPRGVYGFVHEQRIIYVGSSYLKLPRLEYNHRNAWKLGYTITYFREQLIDVYKGKGTFRWLVSPVMCNQRQIETGEEAAIGLYSPRCNIDKHPVRTSRRYGRYY